MPDCGYYFSRKQMHDKAYWLCEYNNTRRKRCRYLKLAETDIHRAFTRMVDKLTQYRKYIGTPLLEQIELIKVKSEWKATYTFKGGRT